MATLEDAIDDLEKQVTDLYRTIHAQNVTIAKLGEVTGLHMTAIKKLTRLFELQIREQSNDE